MTEGGELRFAFPSERTIGELIHMAQLAGDCQGCLGFTMLPSLWAAGQHMIKGPLGNQTVNVAHDAPLKTMLEAYRTMWAGHMTPVADQTQNGLTWGADFEAGRERVAIHEVRAEARRDEPLVLDPAETVLHEGAEGEEDTGIHRGILIEGYSGCFSRGIAVEFGPSRSSSSNETPTLAPFAAPRGGA